MIDLDFIEGLIRAIDQSGLDSIEIERGGTRIRMAKSPAGGVAAPVAQQPVLMATAPPVPSSGPAPAPIEPAAPSASEPAEAAPPSSDADHLIDVPSPMVGTFYRAPAPDAPSYVDVGKRVAKGDTLCIIEAMKLMNELEAEVSGTVVEILAENAEPVEYGQPLFRIDPT